MNNNVQRRDPWAHRLPADTRRISSRLHFWLSCWQIKGARRSYSQWGQPLFLLSPSLLRCHLQLLSEASLVMHPFVGSPCNNNMTWHYFLSFWGVILLLGHGKSVIVCVWMFSVKKVCSHFSPHVSWLAFHFLPLSFSTLSCCPPICWLGLFIQACVSLLLISLECISCSVFLHQSFSSCSLVCTFLVFLSILRFALFLCFFYANFSSCILTFGLHITYGLCNIILISKPSFWFQPACLLCFGFGLICV